ncbi:nicotinate-nucleotide--dimethylbenzimidazole phosphoribosyltransferase [Pleionea sp. CnH1-48]|uniref:nicotinate-nucleotide--dimethylbenzimidazole phosphoribosyltransferase n=1 Tax=Pleionea sp. CnH1-48 TaxID=2954494 RepID=UPI002097A024|nr:nicotinate-nucleotide--dimethylbenzimidazole phosphoribosyltransferase [Pleionea sp. CnH1-48]MCO7227040.1 nicotinate-nucleotide--dimethylbenzimidazole phosphoribosyltransferase [Pleionea sp. CnH1-48]
MFSIHPLDRSQSSEIQQRIDNKTKPPGALGQLEALAHQLALITDTNRIELRQPTMLVFAADHGIAAENISIAPSSVTHQMVLNFVHGGAAINCFCQTTGMQLNVIDAGILEPIDFVSPILKSQRLGAGTQHFVHSSAMTLQQVSQGLYWGAEIARAHLAQGSNVIALGEMGIGNTSSASAIMAAVTQLPIEQCVGRGTGIDDDHLNKKIHLIEQALEKHKHSLETPEAILSTLGGFEIVQMVGAMLAIAEAGAVILVDGFIATSAALIAHKMFPASKDYMIFCHQSNEAGHKSMLEYLQASALLNLNLRLGEGTGASLAFPLLQAAASFYNDMASFESAGVTKV